MDEFFEEDGGGDLTLGDLVGASGVDNGDVCDADEAEDHVEVGTFKVVGLHGGTGGVFAATGDDDGDFLAGCEAFEAIRTDRECLVETDDVVNPSFQGCGDVEVIHRCGDDDFVGFEEFSDEFVGEPEGGFVFVGVLVGSGESTGDPGEIDVRDFGGGKVAGDDFAADVIGLPLGCEVIAKLA